jgi:hypothetical protein
MMTPAPIGDQTEAPNPQVIAVLTHDRLFRVEGSDAIADHAVKAMTGWVALWTAAIGLF